MRTAKISRDTKETKIALELNLDGSGEGEISTGIGFFDHMLELLKKHALVDLTVKADGDLKVDYHHTVEDVGLVLGKALNEALGDRKGIVRYGFASVPMDEALCETSLDLGVPRLSCERAVEVNDVQLPPPLLAPVASLCRGIVAVDRDVVGTTLPEPHALAVLEVDCRKYDHPSEQLGHPAAGR